MGKRLRRGHTVRNALVSRNLSPACATIHEDCPAWSMLRRLFLGDLGEDRVGGFLITLTDRLFRPVDDPGVGLVGDDQTKDLGHMSSRGWRFGIASGHVTVMRVWENVAR